MARRRDRAVVAVERRRVPGVDEAESKGEREEMRCWWRVEVELASGWMVLVVGGGEVWIR